MTDEPDDQLRARLRDVPAPDPAARERALAAALAVFEEQQAPARRSTRWLMPVAAALVGVLALVGVGTLLGGGDEDGDQSATEAVATTASAGTDLVLRAQLEDDSTDPTVVMAAPAAEAVEERTAADAADASGAVASAPPGPILLSDDDVMAAVAAPGDIDRSPLRACGREIVTSASDQRDPAMARTVLLAVEETTNGRFVLVLAPEGERDACTELDRLPLP